MDNTDLFGDVVVVGAGNAALTAAIAAREVGARVLVFEKAPRQERGGNSRFTGGVVRFAHGGLDEVADLVPELTKAELERLEVSPYPREAYVDDVMRLSEGKADPDLTNILADRSRETLRWMQELGVRFELYQTAVRHADRIYFPAGAVLQFWGGGHELINSLFRAAEGRGVDIVYDAPVKGLLSDSEGRVAGVQAQTPEGLVEVRSRAVVLASGGFEASLDRRARYLGEEWQSVKVRGSRHNTGELLDTVQELGALVGGHWDGCHAVPVDARSPDVGDLSLGDLPTRLSYPMGIMVNAGGERFVDEGSDFKSYSYTRMGPAILRQPGGIAYQIFDQQTVDRLEPRYASVGPPVTADTIAELTRQLGLNPGTLSRTVDEFNRAVQDGPFNPAVRDGKSTQGVYPPKTNWALRLDRPPFQAYPVRCSITFTYGGVLIDERARVMGNDGIPIQGLYAAGEFTGGIFHHNYPSGAGLMLGAVFGRIAGSRAGMHALRSGR